MRASTPAFSGFDFYIPYPTTMEKFSYLTNANAAYIDDLYQQFLVDPNSVDDSWHQFFEGFELGAQRSGGVTLSQTDKEVAVMKLINAYRGRGHLISQTNPVRTRRYHKADLSLDYFGLSDADLDTQFDTGSQIWIGRATLREIVSHLIETYCSSIAAEFRYIPDSAIRQYMHEAMESTANHTAYTVEQQRHMLTHLARAVNFERFLQLRYPGQKRFSLEGCESFIPALKTVFEEGARLGVQEFVMGMAHRGRLNVLVNLFGKPYANMFSEFEGSYLPDDFQGDGDVKYHQGHSADIETVDGHPLHLSLLANPSHLEAVDPVVHGSARVKGLRLYGGDFKKIVPILVHGDAAISGQGVVYESANMLGIEGYQTGGTIHVVINNQVGFTANYRETRTSLYCTDIAKITDSPVFHVNADDVEAVAHVMSLAIRLRQTFGIDVYVDLLGYRRYGHNEGDDPQFTQPLLYRAIGKHPTVLELYQKQLAEQDRITEADSQALADGIFDELEASHKAAQEEKPTIEVNFLGRQWRGLRRSEPTDFEMSPPTGVSERRLTSIVDAISRVPEGFKVYPKMRKIIERRRKLYEEGEVDWSQGELLAYGSLLCENVPIRLSGQDSARGTFAHRHAVLHDMDDETEYTPLNHVLKKQETFTVYNSLLSEYAVLGFEYGYSLGLPRGLTIWEAQFGDFSNGAQIIIDQFISSAESKWQRMSGLVMLLPHGYEGQGPEHSSARLGRYLDLCAEDNIIVVNPTTPANLFHLLRRQVKVTYRKPLVVMTPKSLLRHPKVKSAVSELVDGRFRETLDDDAVDPAKVKRVLLCSGKIYYELVEFRESLGLQESVAIVRVEQFYPIPREQDKQLQERYAGATDWIWVQEEPVNMGAWNFMRARLKDLTKLRQVSRRESASPATGSLKLHKAGQERLMQRSFEGL